MFVMDMALTYRIIFCKHEKGGYRLNETRFVRRQPPFLYFFYILKGDKPSFFLHSGIPQLLEIHKKPLPVCVVD